MSFWEKYNSRFDIKIATKIFLLGFLILSFSMIFIYKFHYKNVLEFEKRSIESQAKIISQNLEKLLFEKIKIVQTLASSNIVAQQLKESNDFYSSLEKEQRVSLINSENRKWMSTTEKHSPFILKYTDNILSKHFKKQQNVIPNEYGEIFLTNRFGALVASTSKLTTFKHYQKYWWKKAFNKGKGAIFIDDRGYDNSVGNYVVGIVVPVIADNKIVGILKANLKILPAISAILTNFDRADVTKVSLIRSGGRIIYEKGITPLSEKISPEIIKSISGKNLGLIDGNDFLTGFSKVLLNGNNFTIKFGGTPKSIDHKLGNRDEQWYILTHKDKNEIFSRINNSIKNFFILGLLILFVVAYLSYFIGRSTAKPIVELIASCKEIAKGNFNIAVTFQSHDEIGVLGDTFNLMTKKLKETTASKKDLEEEIEKRIEAENRLKNILKLNPVVIYKLNSKTLHLEWISENVENMLGYELSDFYNIQNYIDKIHKDDKKIFKTFKNIFEKKELLREYRFFKKDGDIVWIHDKTILVEDINGIQILGALTDMTEHKKMSKAALESEKKFKTIFDSSINAMFISKNGVFIDCNKKALELFRCSKEYILGKRPCDISPDLQEDGSLSSVECEKHLENVQQGSPQLFRWIHKRADGSTFYSEVSLNNIKIDSEIYVIAEVQDITDRIEYEKRLKLLSTIALQSFIVVVITDIDGKIVYVNKAFEKVTGYSYEEALGQNPRILKSFQHSKKFYENLWSTILAGKIWEGEFINKRKDGSIYYEEANIFPITDEKGNIINFAAIKKDITDKKELEENLKQASKLETIGALVAGIAHDFNNILTVISGNAEMAKQFFKTNSSLAQKSLSNTIDAVKRAAELVNKLLAFGRKQPSFPKPVNIAHEIRELKKLLRKLISEDIEIVFDIGSEDIIIFFDTSQLEQILINLFVNARDAIYKRNNSEKKIILKLETTNLPEKNILNLPSGDYVQISVTDTGIGMHKNLIKKIFDPFFTTKETGKGTGLGLSTIYGIVKQNKGGISVSSKYGEGSTFDIFIPVYKQGLDGSAEIKKDFKKLPKGSETILIVEDDEDVKEVFTSILTSLGYNVIEAVNGKDALEVFEKNRDEIDVVISDVIMPKMDGAELYKKIKNINPNIKIIFLSGYPEKILTEKGVGKENSYFIQKPVTSQELAKKLREVIDS